MDENKVKSEQEDGALPGAPVSLWIATTSETNYPQVPENLMVDVAVLGGGISGIATA